MPSQNKRRLIRSKLGLRLGIGFSIWLCLAFSIPQNSQAAISSMPTDVAGQLKTQVENLGLTPVDSIESPVFTPPATATESRVAIPRQINPNPLDKKIIIDLSQQRIYAYEGDKLIFSDLVSTGLTGPTPTGTFKVISRVRSQAMSGPGYYLPGVQWVQYFTGAGHSLHGTYWHNNFGHPMSHGCVNLRNSTAKWFWNWAGYGTTIRIRP